MASDGFLREPPSIGHILQHTVWLCCSLLSRCLPAPSGGTGEETLPSSTARQQQLTEYDVLCKRARYSCPSDYQAFRDDASSANLLCFWKCLHYTPKPVEVILPQLFLCKHQADGTCFKSSSSLLQVTRWSTNMHFFLKIYICTTQTSGRLALRKRRRSLYTACASFRPVIKTLMNSKNIKNRKLRICKSSLVSERPPALQRHEVLFQHAITYSNQRKDVCESSLLGLVVQMCLVGQGCVAVATTPLWTL